jgi:hypothetical protein
MSNGDGVWKLITSQVHSKRAAFAAFFALDEQLENFCIFKKTGVLLLPRTHFTESKQLTDFQITMGKGSIDPNWFDQTMRTVHIIVMSPMEKVVPR